MASTAFLVKMGNTVLQLSVTGFWTGKWCKILASFYQSRIYSEKEAYENPLDFAYKGLKDPGSIIIASLFSLVHLNHKLKKTLVNYFIFFSPLPKDLVAQIFGMEKPDHVTSPKFQIHSK